MLKYALARLTSAFNYTYQKYPFHTVSIVVLPDHIHCIWKLPNSDDDFSKRWNMIKKYFSIGFQGVSNARREKNIWQRRFWEHLIRDEEDLKRCMDYIYYNPVKHGYTKKPYDWPYSDFKKAIAKGYYEKNWGICENLDKIKNLQFE